MHWKSFLKDFFEEKLDIGRVKALSEEIIIRNKRWKYAIIRKRNDGKWIRCI